MEDPRVNTLESSNLNWVPCSLKTNSDVTHWQGYRLYLGWIIITVLDSIDKFVLRPRGVEQIGYRLQIVSVAIINEVYLLG